MSAKVNVFHKGSGLRGRFATDHCFGTVPVKHYGGPPKTNLLIDSQLYGRMLAISAVRMEIAGQVLGRKSRGLHVTG
ncbi:hypothetical protein SB748_31955, partial [Rhizobium sp. SIMBA_035]